MTPVLWKAVSTLVSACLDLPAEEREKLLAEAEAKNPEVAEEARQLLQIHEENRDFLESPFLADFTTVSGKYWPDDAMPDHIGPYRITSKLGHGGMGTVYLAIRSDHQFEQEVAVKLIKRGLDTDDILRRFYQERQILARLIHPNIARLLDVGSTKDGRPYFVMERVRGQRIDAYCAANQLSLTQRLRLFQQVCDAVRYAHQHLVIHRDIKPGNILVTEEGTPKLLDFGVAKLLASTAEESGMTAPTAAAFTPEYASPEQLRGEPVSTATDVYSLGLLLRELLGGDSTGKLPVDLQSIIGKAVSDRPQDRYSSAEQLMADIERYLDGQPVVARRQTFAYRTWKFIRRHQIPVAAGLAVALGLTTTTSWALWQTHLARQQRGRAERRFAQVRHIANVLLFQVHDSIQGLPGATPVRKKLAQESLQYLDSLAADSDNDLVLRKEIVGGYRKLALVQGHPMNPNEGSPTDALKSLEKAVQLQQSIVAAQHGCAPCKEFLATLYEDKAAVLDSMGKRSEAQEFGQQAVAMQEELVRKEPNNLEFRMDLATVLLHASALYVGNSTLGMKEALLRRALDLFHELASNSYREKRLLTQFAFAEMRMGGLQMVYHANPTGAREHYQKAAALYRERMAEQPDDNMRRYDLTFALSDLAYLQGREGKIEQAIAGYREVLSIREGIAAADPNDKRVPEGVAKTCDYLSRLYLQNNNYPQALQYAERSLIILEALSRGNPSNTDMRMEVAMANQSLGSIYLAWAHRKIGSRTIRQERLNQAIQHLSRALPVFREWAAKGELIGTEAQGDKHIEAQLAECRTALNSLRP